MTKLTILIYLHDDPPNDLVSRVQYVEGKDRISLLRHDGVTQLSGNALLFDQTKSHDVYVRVCRELVSIGRPYLVVELEATSALAVGPCSKEVATNLLKYGVPLCPSLPNPS